MLTKNANTYLLNNFDLFVVLIPMQLLLSVILIYSIGDVNNKLKSIGLSVLSVIPFGIVHAFNSIGNDFITSLILYILVFGVCGVLGGFVGLYFYNKKLEINSIDKSSFYNTKEYKLKHKNSLILIITFFAAIIITGLITASPIAWMEHNGEVDNLIYIVQYGHPDNQILAMEAL